MLRGEFGSPPVSKLVAARWWERLRLSISSTSASRAKLDLTPKDVALGRPPLQTARPTKPPAKLFLIRLAAPQSSDNDRAAPSPSPCRESVAAAPALLQDELQLMALPDRK